MDTREFKMKIKAIDYIENGFSADDANKIIPLIQKALDQGDIAIVDFTGVKYYTTLFFNLAFTKYIGKLDKDKYNERIRPIGLTKAGQSAYDHSYENAVEYFSMSKKERKLDDEFINSNLKS